MKRFYVRVSSDAPGSVRAGYYQAAPSAQMAAQRIARWWARSAPDGATVVIAHAYDEDTDARLVCVEEPC